MPPNMYGPGDNYDLQNSHFFSALINKITHCAKKIIKNILFYGVLEMLREN